MTGRFRNHIVLLLLCLSVLPKALRAQGYTIPDRPPYHAASIYYVTLQNADGVPVNNQYAGVEGAIGAFVGSELRGASQWLATGNGEGIFMVRVWGDDNDPATATFRLRDQQGLEYQISSQPFAQGEEDTYGTPSEPIAMTIIPVTGISLPFQEITLKQSETVSVQPTLLPANHSTLLTTLQYTYSSDAAAFTVSSNGMITGVAVGEGKVTVKATPGNFTQQATVKVEAGIPYVAVTEIKNNMASTTLTMTEGDKLTLDYSVLPENATNQAVSFKNNYSIIDIQQETETSLPTLIAKKAGKDTLTVIAADNEQITLTYYITVKERVIPDVTLTFASQELTASKLRDVTLTLTKGANDDVVADRVELIFPKAANNEPVATAVMADATGLKWTVRGQYVGKHTVKIKYNGKEQKATCTVNIPGEYPIQQGWNWMSFYAIGKSGTFPLQDANGIWISLMKKDEDNLLADIRTQNHVLHYDVQYGFLGNLETLRADEGSFKIRAEYEDEYAGDMVINVGYDNLLTGSNLPNPKVVKGYTWVNYPHEISHSIEVLGTYLAKTAAEGDMVIGSDGFAEFDGDGWIASEDFTFLPGSGYIYYTESTVSRSLDWGPATLAPDPAAAPAASKPVAALWQYRPRQYADCMPVIVRLDGIDHPEEYTIGAFTGNECRGTGEASANGLMTIAVNGEKGDLVSFRLYHKPTGTLVDIRDSGLSFSGHAGSHRAPVVLHPDVTAVRNVTADMTTDSSECFDLQGRRIKPAGSKGLYIITVTHGGHRVTRKIISK